MRYHQTPYKEIDPYVDELKRENEDFGAFVFMLCVVVAMVGWLFYRFIEAI